MSEEITKVLDALCEKLGIAIDWSAENVWPYVQQIYEHLIRYELFSNILWIVLSILFAASAGVAAKVFVPRAIEDGWDNEWSSVPAILSIIVLCISLLMLLSGACTWSHQIVTCCVFPEKILIDYIRPML